MSIVQVAQWFIPLSVFMLMVCVGFELSLADFRRVLVFPRAIITGITGQMLLMPSMAFLIATLFGGSLSFQIGIVLLAACPGGPLSNSLVYVGRGRTDLSVSMTAINGFLALATTPLIATLGIRVFAGENADIELPVLKTIVQIFLLAILPVATGMLLKAKFPKFAERRQLAAQRLASVLLVSHVALVVGLNSDRIMDGMSEMMLPAVLFMLLAQMIGYFSARAAKLDSDTAFTIAIEVGLQNVVLAVLIANILLKRPEFSLFVVNYAAGVMFVMAPWVILRRYRSRHRGDSGDAAAKKLAAESSASQ